jgi:hypothetical protein
LPVPLVVVGLAVVNVPQAAPLMLNSTVSPARKPPPVAVTVAVTTDVVTPSAGMLVGLAATVIEAAPAEVWVTVAVAPVLFEGSVALMEQKPFVVEAV